LFDNIDGAFHLELRKTGHRIGEKLTKNEPGEELPNERSEGLNEIATEVALRTVIVR
jgi:hypothetical protein